jgi:3-hydroxyisobutyrate dehydrogenase-like beta-hydroxyacid dehydrogenase
MEGFIGLGTMGAAMTTNLQKVGYKLVCTIFVRTWQRHITTRALIGPTIADARRVKAVLPCAVHGPTDNHGVIASDGEEQEPHDQHRWHLAPCARRSIRREW